MKYLENLKIWKYVDFENATERDVQLWKRAIIIEIAVGIILIIGALIY